MKLIKSLALASLFSYGCATEKNTLVDDFLINENRFITSKKYKITFDEIIKDIVPKLKKPNKSDGYINLHNLKTIDWYLRKSEMNKNGLFSYKSNLLLSTCFTDKIMDCDTAVTLYLGIDDVYKLNIYPVYAPTHALLGLKYNGSEMFWETTKGRTISKEKLIKEFNISKKAIDEGIWLTKKTRKEYSAINYINLAAFQYKHGDNFGALDNLDYALKLDKKNPFAKVLKGEIFIQLSKNVKETNKIYYNNYMEQALDCFSEVLSKDPNNFVAYEELTKYYLIKGDKETAIKSLKISYKLKKRDKILKIIKKLEN